MMKSPGLLADPFDFPATQKWLKNKPKNLRLPPHHHRRETMATTRTAVVVEREELVLSPNPLLRKCHFLNPCLPSSHQGPFPFPPPVSLPFPPGFDTACPDHLSDIRFNYPCCPTKGWVEWVEVMEQLHRPTWRKAGISGAIRCSTYRIRRDKGLILGLAEKWCPETSSFVFPWGEASVTLEDVYVLWGYSVHASPVSTWDGEMEEMERRLKAARSEIIKTRARKASCGRWMDKFKGSGSDNEHEAFLAFWLSRFVFPHSSEVIYEDLLPFAIHLARGDKVAIAPAVLASIYRELSLLKKHIRDLAGRKSDSESSRSDMMLWAPLGILQVWAWERFVYLRPRPKIISPGEPRLSRWDNVGCSEPKNIRVVLDMIDAGNRFEWRPYTKEVQNFEVPRFYGERERWEQVGGDGVEDDEEILVFARCLVPCELEGLESTEQYLPHRVAMQFGMDQDIPDRISWSDESAEVSWRSYDSSFHDAWLYLPSRGYTPCLTKRYDDWRRLRAKDGPMKRWREVAEGSGVFVRPGFCPIPQDVAADQSSDEDDDDHLTLRERWSKLTRRGDFQSRSRVSERLTKKQKSTGSVAGDQNSLPPGSKLESATIKCPSESHDNNDGDHSTPEAIPFGQQKSIADDRVTTPSECNTDSVQPHESPSWRNIVILSESEETSDEHEPIRENTSKDPTTEGAGSSAEDDHESSAEGTGKQERGASLGRNRTIFTVDMLELGIADRISKLEKDVAALKLSRSKIY